MFKNMKSFQSLGIRTKLIVLFVIIKVLPLLLLGWLAWNFSDRLANNLSIQTKTLVDHADQTVKNVGEIAIADAIAALNDRSREDIERLTTDTALNIAYFLQDRDEDIQQAAALELNEHAFRNFISNQKRNRIVHGPWKLAQNESSWEPLSPYQIDTTEVNPGTSENANHFHYSPPHAFETKREPLYLEISFVGLDGQEKIKVTTSDLLSSKLQNVSDRRNTFIRAETYFPELKRLKPKEIYVSDVIGAYVGSKVIGTYTPKAAAAAGIPYDPQNSAYAGKENPVGKRFRGLIRWATPVIKNNQHVGWVTLAMDHNHLMTFTDHMSPVSQNYSDISDASDGNYAFIWDYKGRSIVHPRHHSITGYDPETGEPALPWLEDTIYKEWQESGQDFKTFSATAPTFRDQKQGRKPASELTQAGYVGLDCRFLNFAPQCTGWGRLTEHGGSGSFEILWSGLSKLTTAAAIPYYTGHYGKSKRGFGIVTIGANVRDFHKPATESKERLDKIVAQANTEMLELNNKTQLSIVDSMLVTGYSLTVSTLIMVGLIILIAIWMASYLLKHIRSLVNGITRFSTGERAFRFDVSEKTDEIDQLAFSFNTMADTLDENLTRLENEINIRSKTEAELREIKDNLEGHIQERTHELSQINLLLRDEIEVRRLAEARAQHLAGHDPLTGLANRMLFNDRLLHTINDADRTKQHAALLFFDLDRFKVTNDSLGHAVGDALLVHVTQVLQNRARKTDTIARLGGDEFAIIMNQLSEPESAAILAGEIINQLAQPIMIEDHEVHTGASIGITIISGNKADPEQILLQADMAMYQAKAEGGSRFHFFEESMQNAMTKRKAMEAELRIALSEHQFQVYYQPQYNCVENRIVGVEALVRWKHPVKGLVTPGYFLDIANRCGLMTEIDKEVYRMACAQAQQWVNDGIEFGRVAINIPPKELSKVNFVASLMEELANSNLSPHQLELEITERSLLQDSLVAIDNLTALRKMDVVISIDDFGIEYSSLQRLVEYPVDIIKIDRFFVSRIGEQKSEAVIEAIVAMARSMGLELIAEGVETEEQLSYLLAMHCNVVQGYIKAPPMSAIDATLHIKASTLDRISNFELA